MLKRKKTLSSGYYRINENYITLNPTFIVKIGFIEVYIFYLCCKTYIVGTHNQCFEQNIKISFFPMKFSTFTAEKYLDNDSPIIFQFVVIQIISKLNINVTE